MPKHEYKQPPDSQYDVGYKKPPRQGQFKKGQSGNPRGRPKKKPEIPDLRVSLANALNERVAVNENGKTRYLTKLDVAMVQAANKAAAGNLGPLRLLLPVVLKFSEAANANATGQGNEASSQELEKELDNLFATLMRDQKVQPVSQPSDSNSESEGSSDNTPAVKGSGQ